MSVESGRSLSLKLRLSLIRVQFENYKNKVTHPSKKALKLLLLELQTEAKSPACILNYKVSFCFGRKDGTFWVRSCQTEGRLVT